MYDYLNLEESVMANGNTSGRFSRKQFGGFGLCFLGIAVWILMSLKILFPIQVVCDWIGNTEAIASKHDLQVTEDHFATAVQNPVWPSLSRPGFVCLFGA